MMDSLQKDLIQRLYEVLVEINEQAINDDQFYIWLNKNFFFEEDLEEAIIKVKKSIESSS